MLENHEKAKNSKFEALGVQKDQDCSDFIAFKSHENGVEGRTIDPEIDEFGKNTLEMDVDHTYKHDGLAEGYNEKPVCNLVRYGTDVCDHHVAIFDSSVQANVDQEYE